MHEQLHKEATYLADKTIEAMALEVKALKEIGWACKTSPTQIVMCKDIMGFMRDQSQANITITNTRVNKTISP